METTPTVAPTFVRRGLRLAVCGLLAACGGFEQRAEFWPAFDASSGGIGGTGGSVVGTTSSGETSAGGATGTGGAGNAGGDPSTTTGEGGTIATTGTGGAGGDGTAGAGGSGLGGAGGGSVDAGKGTTGGAGGRAGSAGAGGTQGGGGSSGSCSLAVTVTTVTNNGTYSPRNIGAIWVTNDNGAFVKTLAVWARTRIRYLTLWNSTTSAAGMSGSTVDAVTGATLSSHQTHKVTWNCTDASRNVVPDGAYRVYFEMTDRSGTGPNTFVNFTKGSMPLTLMPPDQKNFTGMSLVFTP